MFYGYVVIMDNIQTDEQLLDELINKEAESITKDQKFKIIKGGNNHFLPPIDDIAVFFNFKHDAKTLYKLVSQQNISVPKISHSSLDNLYRHGVGKSVFMKFMEVIKKSPKWLRLAMIPHKYPWIDRALAVNSNAASWLEGALLYQDMANNPDINQMELLYYQKLVDFICQRCYREIAFFEACKQKHNAGEVDLTDQRVYWKQEAYFFYQQNTQLDESVFTSINQIIQGSDVQAYSDIQKVELIEHILTLKFDFLLNCIACYDVGYLVANDALSVNADNKYGHSVICRIIERYTHSDNNETCFHSCWEVIKCILQEHGGELSNRQLASFIHIKQKEGTIETLRDAQYNVLKKWFKQQDLPSADKLSSFVDDFSASIGFEGNNHLLLITKMALAIDACRVEKAQIIKAEFGVDIDVIGIWKQVWGQYTKYYQYHCHQHLTK